MLRRPKLARYGLTPSDIEDIAHLLAPLLPRVEVDVPLRDPGDVPVVATAVVGAAEVILTGEADLLADAAVRHWLLRNGIEPVTAVEALRRLDP